MAVAWQYGLFVYIFNQSVDFPSPLSGIDFHFKLFFSNMCGFLINPVLHYCSLQLFWHIFSDLEIIFFSFGMSQCGVDINKNDYKQVKKCANDA